VSVIAMTCGGMTTHASLAQTVSQTAAEHQDLGNHLTIAEMVNLTGPSITDSKTRRNGPKSSMIPNETHGKSQKRFWMLCV
jgi:hypothetical protein